jgi:tryptophanyl-tRNA synthetase
LEIAAALSHQSIEQIAAQYQNAGYGAFKRAVAEIAVETTRRVRQEALTLQSDPAEIVRRLDTGRRMAEAVANPKLRQVKQAMGFLLP